jgi:hypothetical protein
MGIYLTGDEMKDRDTEIREAIDAADNALFYLRGAEKSCESAGNWGVFDILGGGFFATMIKRDKMSKTEKDVVEAKKAIEKLNLELDDIESIIDINIETGDFLTFADYFFDGFIADIMVQDKISKGLKEIKTSIRNIEEVKTKLESLLRQ